jgi:surface polysaccharide O-acyltransferase-like enzyme
MKKPKLLELDLVRAIAILAVVIIHATSYTQADIPGESRSRTVYYFFNTVSTFAVPVFIMLSGLVLFYRYSGGWKAGDAVSFYRKRLQFVVVPYLVWSLFYYFYDQWMGHRFNPGAVGFNLHTFAENLKWGDNKYHLYYIIIIAQFYLIFPLLMTAVSKWKWIARYLIPLGIAVHLGFYIYARWYHTFIHRPDLCLTYFALFCIGGYIGMHYEAFMRASKHLLWVGPLTAALGITHFLLYYNMQRSIVFNLTYYDVVFYLYPVGVCVSLLWIGRRVVAGLPRVTALLTSLGAASFGIYLMHPAVLSTWKTYMIFSPYKYTYHLGTLVSFGVSLLIPWAVFLLVKRRKGSWVLFGR